MKRLSKFFRDLFYGPGNENADLGRIVGFVGVLMMLGGQVWNMLLGLPLELGPTGLGGGLAAVIGAAAALIYAKDRAKAETVVAKAVSDATPVAPASPATKK
jgi:hypothetical protein